MHVVIAGCGRVGSQMTRMLTSQGHSVAIIDKNPAAFDRLAPGFEGRTLVGIVFDQDTLEAAGIKEAGAFVAVTNGDNSNIVSTRIAREHYNVPKVVARIYDPRRAEIYRKLGIPTVATVQWASGEIFDMLFHGIEHAELNIGDGEMVILRTEIPPALAGRNASDLGDGVRAQVIAIDRMGSASIPSAQTTFQEGDIAHIIIRRDAIETLHAKLQGSR
ncbi:MAG: potassium channel family protein [Actinomycetota bacterium]